MGKGGADKSIMNMIIEKIILKKEGRLCESLNFKKGLNIIGTATESYDIIKMLMGKGEEHPALQDMRFRAEVRLDKRYILHGSKFKGDPLWNVTVFSDGELCTDEFFNLVKCADEPDSVLFFHRFKKQDFPHRIMQYKNITDFYTVSQFKSLTNGFGTTRAFRNFISDYINNFKPLRLENKKDIFLHLSKNGELIVKHQNGTDAVVLSEGENTLYHYFCFITTADFWDKFEEIRNLNFIRKPLIISSFIERMDENINVCEILKRTDALNRQTIMFVPNKIKVGLDEK